VASTWLTYAQALRKLNRKREAKEYEKRAREIQTSRIAEDPGRHTIDARSLARQPTAEAIR
jgi:hypothetical protein